MHKVTPSTTSRQTDSQAGGLCRRANRVWNYQKCDIIPCACREFSSMWMKGMEAEASGNLEAAIQRYTSSPQGLGTAGEDAVTCMHVHCLCPQLPEANARCLLMLTSALACLTGTVGLAGNVTESIERRLRSRLRDLCISVGDFDALANTAWTGTPSCRYVSCMSYG